MSSADSEVTNTYKYPYYFSTLYGHQENQRTSIGLQDLTLGEYTLCSRSKSDLNNLVGAVANFIDLLAPNRRNINSEKEIYAETAGCDGDVLLFSNLLTFLQTRSPEFTLQFGAACAISPSFAHSIKSAYAKSPILNTDKQMANLLEVIVPTDIFSQANIPEKFIVMLVNSMMASVIEKLTVNFKGSEFVLAFNLAIMEFNLRQFGMIEKIASCEKLYSFLSESCIHSSNDVKRIMERLASILERANLLPDGTIDYLGWAYENRTESDIKRIESAKLVGNVILGNSWNEILENTYIKSLYLTNIVYPNSQGS